jgi:major membrane immunogen (membrane-anchored lipoprotein)
MRQSLLFVCLIATWVIPTFAGVTVTSPTGGATVLSPVKYVATAKSPDCSKGVAAIGIYTAPGQLAYVTKGSSLNTSLSLSPGTYNTTVQQWDNCGWTDKEAITITVSGSASQVQVIQPSNFGTVSSPVEYVASATTSCSKGVSAMGIYTAPGKLAYHVDGSSIDTTLSLSPGTYNTTVQEWDNCGGTAKTPITITVSSSDPGNTFYNLHTDPGWDGYALLPPTYGICDYCNPGGPETTWSWTPGISSPSKSGDATKTTIGGDVNYSDVLWNNKMIGHFSTQGLPDDDHKLIPTLHNFTYDVWFYGTSLETSQALEFDINQFFDGNGYIWGHECRIAGGHEWYTWDNDDKEWVATGVDCNPVSNSWNHLVIQVQRTTDNKLLFQSITLNGVTNNLNIVRNHGSAPGWYGVTINYQIDGNKNQDPYTVYIDQLNFTYQ